MADELLMPKLGMTMEEGVLTEWFKQEGDEVEQGEPVFEVMTDKINIEVESPKSGVLLKVLAHEGETVPVNQVVGYIGEEGEDVPDKTADAIDNKADESERSEAVSSEKTTFPAEENDETVNESEDNTKRNGNVRATPSARRLARIHNIDLHTVSGTGPRGRIQARDVEEAVGGQERRLPEVDTQPGAEKAARSTESAKQPAAVNAAVATANYEEVPFKGIRKVIGERMVQSVQQAPHVTLNRWVTMEAASRFKKEWEDAVRDETGHKLSINDLLVMAAARALKQHSEINATLEGDTIRQYGDVNIGIAVQTDYGLIVPVLHEVNRLNVGELVKRFREKVEKARNRTLSTEDTSGGTFTISNLGGYDIETFTPIINQPQAAILGVGKIVTQPEWNGETWDPVKKMPLSLSFDHRLVDGAPAAAFLQTLARYLEEPRKLLI